MQQPQIEGDKPNYFVGMFREGFLLCSFRGRYETYESAESMCIFFESCLNKAQFFTGDREADYVAVDFVERYEERDIVANQVDLTQWGKSGGTVESHVANQVDFRTRYPRGKS